jgi:CRISPR-associated protein Cas2
MLIIVSYDIVDDKRRTKLAKRLCDFGKRVQYSVFECDLSKEQLKDMTEKALKQIDQEEDSLRIYRICNTCANEILSYGIKKGWEEDDVIVK